MKLEKWFLLFNSGDQFGFVQYVLSEGLVGHICIENEAEMKLKKLFATNLLPVPDKSYYL